MTLATEETLSPTTPPPPSSYGGEWGRQNFGEDLRRVAPEWFRVKRVATRSSVNRATCYAFLPHHSHSHQIVAYASPVVEVEQIKPVQPSPEEKELFSKLAHEWRHETSASSVLMQKVMHRAYQQIIAIGPPVIPLILAEMQRIPGHWFWALDALTHGRHNPAKGSKTLTEATTAWIKWGKAEDLI
jgi:hypothetical protein